MVQSTNTPDGHFLPYEETSHHQVSPLHPARSVDTPSEHLEIRNDQGHHEPGNKRIQDLFEQINQPTTREGLLKGRSASQWELVDEFVQYEASFWGQRYHLSPEQIQDAAQEALQDIYRNLHQHDPKKKLSAWIITIISRKISHLADHQSKRKKIESHLSPDDGETNPHFYSHSRPHISAEKAFLEAEGIRHICRTLEDFAHQYRHPERAAYVVEECFLNERHVNDVADAVGITPAGVYDILRKAREYVAQHVPLNFVPNLAKS
jgi:RNA polymerase sigma factor (sigma-70 family)